ncbi:hypothetical protein LX36DRAFT_207055 [Colletotrichum falcatum]|nr:hypothetical protein LX36DRAFT_207055 [Colletotrichum falcatum]
MSLGVGGPIRNSDGWGPVDDGRMMECAGDVPGAVPRRTGTAVNHLPAAKAVWCQHQPLGLRYRASPAALGWLCLFLRQPLPHRRVLLWLTALGLLMVIGLLVCIVSLSCVGSVA